MKRSGGPHPNVDEITHDLTLLMLVNKRPTKAVGQIEKLRFDAKLFFLFLLIRSRIVCTGYKHAVRSVVLEQRALCDAQLQCNGDIVSSIYANLRILYSTLLT